MTSHAHFEKDDFPGHPKILFIGMGSSSHNISWINLLSQSRLNVRLFAMPNGGFPPSDWKVRTYLPTQYLPKGLDMRLRSSNYPTPEEQAALEQAALEKDKRRRPLFYKFWDVKDRFCFSRNKAIRSLENISAPIAEDPAPPMPADQWLARIIREWKPDIIHTLGLAHDQGGLFYHQVRLNYDLAGLGKWILQLRGGSDLTLNRHDSLVVSDLRDALHECDQIISDNVVNIEYAEEMGVPRKKFASIVPVPGTGGIDIESVKKLWTQLPSKRERIIIWPKAYDCTWSLALPVFEAIINAWESIKPCRIFMLVMTTETTKEWFNALPREIRESSQTYDRISHKETLNLLTRARVMLSPSLVDGIPNSLYEAMASGAFPIVSPIETISRVFVDGQNGLFARNLYPEEIAHALRRAMNDDQFVDEAAIHNLEFVERVANRSSIRKKVIAYYESIIHAG
ncbi:MAG: glycosyltransferase family 4 protein [Desulfobacula sp.]|nr:glycosyltransferase family 4 protein [Desulfobacula sp.]